MPAADPPAGQPRDMAATPASFLLEVDGMRCGGCVRAVERKLLQQSGVSKASVSLLTRTAWVSLNTPRPIPSGGDGSGCDALAELLAGLESLGFQARLRDQEAGRSVRPPGNPQRHWWQRWRDLVVALTLLLLSGLGHLADAGGIPWGGTFAWLGAAWFHALLASIVLAGPGRPILVQGARAALGGAPTMDTLVGLAVASAYGSSLVGWLNPGSGWPCFFHEPVMLLGVVLAGRFLEERARWRASRSIEALASLQPDHAHLVLEQAPPLLVRVGVLRPGDRLQLLPGDRVPVDGVVREGRSCVDLSVLTGESLPQVAESGCELVAGTLVLEAPLQMEVTRSGADSAIARIVALVEQAQLRKAPIQGLADRLAGNFTILVLALALITFLFWWLWGWRIWPEVLALPSLATHPGHGPLGVTPSPLVLPISLALQQAIAVLVVACPCALGLATPTALSVGSGLAARSGLLFRGGDAIEAAAALRTLLFDKTGTLTRGRPQVIAVASLEGEGPSHSDRLVQVAASLEQQSRHPLGHAVLEEARRRDLPLLPVSGVHSTGSQGLEGLLDGHGPPARVGRLAWLLEKGVSVPERTRTQWQNLATEGATLLAVSEGDRLIGMLTVEDHPRSDAAATLTALRERGLQIGMLSGDHEGSVRQLGQRLGLNHDQLAWDLLPQEKLQRILRARESGMVAMVGDGINDAPALAAADLGIAVGTGTQIAQECAGLVVLGDQLGGVVRALDLARRTMAKVRQNLLIAFSYNLIMLPIAAGVLLPGFGMRLSPPLSALLMTLSSISVVANALLLDDRPGPWEEKRG